MVSIEGHSNDNGDRLVPEPGRIAERKDFAFELTLARERAGKTVRDLAREVGEPPATIGGYLSGQHLPPLRQTDLFRRILGCLDIADCDEVERWVEALARLRRKPGPRPTAAATPYRGLEGFRVEDSEWFFGRESLTESLIAKLAELVDDPGAGSFVVVVGPSGSGKSSLLRAGVVPAVLNGDLERGSGWRCLLLTPGSSPVRTLAEQLASTAAATPEEVERGLRSVTLDWPDAVGEGGVVVVVDQFEELFTLCHDEAERQVFIAALSRLSRVGAAERGHVAVVLGLRADFYGRAAREPALVPILQDHQVIVGSMTTEQLRRVISEPARLAGFEVDPELVDLLMSEFVPRGSPSGLHDPGALPLLSHALLETFKRARRGRLTVADYLQTGGISGAICQTAEQVFNDLAPGEQALARRVFLRLVNVNDDAAAITRRRVPRSDLPTPVKIEDGRDSGGAARGGAARGGELERVVDCFVTHRLLTVHENEVEVSHEALLSAWPRLVDWLDADRAGLRVRRQLSEAAQIWTEAGRDPSGFLRGGRLEAALAWASLVEHGEDLNELERSFLEASEDDDLRQRSTTRRRTRRLQALAAVVTALAVATSALAVIAIGARNSAVHARDLALSRQVALEATQLRGSDPSLASQLALASYRISATPEARSALLDSSAVPTPTRLLGQPGTTALGVAGDGAAMAVGRAVDGSVQLYSLPATGEPMKQGVLKATTPGSAPYAVTFSPNGSTVAVGGTDNAVQLWDVADLRQPRPLGGPLTGFTAPVLSVAFSPDGRTLAAAGTGPGVLRWDVSTAARPVPLTPLTPTAATTATVAFSPGGGTVAAGGTDGTVRLWSTTGSDPHLLAELPNPAPTTINSVAFSPDGHLLAAGDKRKTIQRWDVSNPSAPSEIGPPLTGFTSWVNSVAFSPDGRTLAAGSSDSTIRLWDVDSWQPRASSLSNPAPVSAIAFLPDGSGLVSVAGDGVARLWPQPGPVIDGPTDSIYALVYSSDGRRLAVVPTRASGIPIWDASNSEHPRRLGQANMPADIGVPGGSGAVSPNGQILAAGTSKGNVQLFDVADPTRPIPLGPPLAQSSTLVEQVNFSRDGHLLTAGGDDNTIVMWDVSDPSHPTLLSRLTGPTAPIYGIAFSADGRLVAAASIDKTVRLWNIATPQRPVATATLTGFEDYVSSVAFSPNNHVLVAGSADKTVRLWDISDPSHPRPLGGAIAGPDNNVNFVAIDPGGRTLAAAVSGGSVWQWDITDPAHPRHTATLTAEPGDINVLAFSPDGRTLAAAGSDKTVYLWNTDPQQIAQEICAASGDSITRKEWAQYIPNRPFVPPCR